MAIGRRSFITGLVSLIAAPAVVRARVLKDGRFTYYSDENLECRHFDFANGGGCTAIYSCTLTRCTFKADDTTVMVNLQDCILVDTDLAPLGVVPPEQLLLRHNYATTLIGHGEIEKCTGPMS